VSSISSIAQCETRRCDRLGRRDGAISTPSASMYQLAGQPNSSTRVVPAEASASRGVNRTGLVSTLKDRSRSKSVRCSTRWPRRDVRVTLSTVE